MFVVLAGQEVDHFVPCCCHNNEQSKDELLLLSLHVESGWSYKVVIAPSPFVQLLQEVRWDCMGHKGE